MSERYRRSPHLICYWEGPSLVLQNYAAGTRVSAAPIACQLLHFFDRWRTAGEFAAHFPDITAESLGRSLTSLIRARLLDYSSAPRDPREKAFREWQDWSPAALYFHLSTKDAMSPIEPEDSVRELRRRARIKPMPPPCKRYPKAPHVKLPVLDTGGEFERVLRARRTSRKFSKAPATLAQLSKLLALSFGVQWWLDLKGMGRVALKTSPSGGSRHPIEAYVVALRVDGLPRGLYHYDSAAHRLALLRKGSSAKEVTRHLNGQWWFGGAAAVVYMTAVFARTQWKYPTSRAYRVILADADPRMLHILSHRNLAGPRAILHHGSGRFRYRKIARHRWHRRIHNVCRRCGRAAKPIKLGSMAHACLRPAHPQPSPCAAKESPRNVRRKS